MKHKIKLIVFSILTLPIINPSLFAQKDIEEKLNKIDSKVDKIVITADGKEYSFEGEEAQKLFREMKEGSSHNLSWTMQDLDEGNKKVIFINKDGKEEVIEIESEGNENIIIKTNKDFDREIDGIQKKVKVEIEDDNKKVTVTTKENGEEKTEVYEGKEAEEYLDKMKSENDDIDIMIKKNSDDKKVKKIIIKTEKKETEE